MTPVSGVRPAQEATKFKQAMADPEFQSMLKDYMEEIQDPAARAVSLPGSSIPNNPKQEQDIFLCRY